MLINKIKNTKGATNETTGARRAAFTLAEILITLAIIGVVAALTMPTLISNYKKQATVTALQKSFSTFAQAIQMAEVEHGPANTWGLDWTDDDRLAGEKVVLEYLKPYLKISKICLPTSDECWTPAVSSAGEAGFLTNADPRASFLMENGQAVQFWIGGPLGSNLAHHIQIWVDIDGPYKGDSMMGKDVFGFFMNFVDDDDENPRKVGNTLYLRGDELKENSLETLKNNSSYGCLKSTTGKLAGLYCGAVIAKSGWKIPDDYPVKF